MKHRATRSREAERAIREAEKSGNDYLCLSNLDVEGEVPSSIGKLKALRRFRCESAKLHSLPEEFGKLRELRLLCLNQNQFEVFPEVVLKFKRFEILEIGWNQLKTIPKGIGRLKNLQAIVLCANEFERLPDSIGELGRLVGLTLHDNPLRSLPRTVGKLKRLEQLDLRATSISKLPRSVARLPNLRTLNLEDNPNLPPDLVRICNERGMPAVRKYLLGQDDPDAFRFKDIDHFHLPEDFLAYLRSRSPKTFNFRGASDYGYPPFRVLGRKDLHVEWLPVLPFDGGPGGPWHIPMVNLILQEGHPKNPTRILVWLPDQKRYATSDCESHNLFIFHEETTWTTIVKDFRSHFLATNTGGDPDPKFAVRYEESACFGRMSE